MNATDSVVAASQIGDYISYNNYYERQEWFTSHHDFGVLTMTSWLKYIML